MHNPSVPTADSTTYYIYIYTYTPGALYRIPELLNPDISTSGNAEQEISQLLECNEAGHTSHGGAAASASQGCAQGLQELRARMGPAVHMTRMGELGPY